MAAVVEVGAEWITVDGETLRTGPRGVGSRGAAGLLATALTACNSEPDSAGSVTVLASCPDDGAGGVHITFGEIDHVYSVGGAGGRQGSDGGHSVTKNYELLAGEAETRIEVGVRPSRGQCEGSITDYETGKVLWESGLTVGQSEGSVIVAQRSR